MEENYYVIDVVGEGFIKKNAFVSKDIKMVNNWIAFYFNNDCLPQIRITNKVEKYEMITF